VGGTLAKELHSNISQLYSELLYSCDKCPLEALQYMFTKGPGLCLQLFPSTESVSTTVATADQEDESN